MTGSSSIYSETVDILLQINFLQFLTGLKTDWRQQFDNST